MPFTIRRPIQIELPRPQQDAADERKRARLAEETEKFLEEATRRASEKAQQQAPDFMARAIERAKEIAAERGPPPEPEAPEEGGGGFLGGLRDVGRGALDVGRAAVRGIDVGLEAAAPFAGEIAERGFRAQPVGQAIEAIRAIPGVPTTGGGPTITDFARRPFVPGAEQVGQATQFTFENPLAAMEAEVEFGRPITEPVSRALGRGAVAALPAGQAVDVATQGKLSDIAADIGGVIGPELAVLSNAIPVEAVFFAGPKILFRATKVTPKVLEVLARVAKGGSTIDVLEAGVKSDLLKFADEAAVELRKAVQRPIDEGIPTTLTVPAQPARGIQPITFEQAKVLTGQGVEVVVHSSETGQRIGTVTDAAIGNRSIVGNRGPFPIEIRPFPTGRQTRRGTAPALIEMDVNDITFMGPPGRPARPATEIPNPAFREAPTEPQFTERFGLPAEQITAETRIPPGVSREAPLTGQQVADLPVGQVELPFPRTRNAQEIAQLAAERRNNLRAVQEGAEAGTNSVDDVLAAEAELAVARQSDNAARVADVEDLTKTSFDEVIENARRACRG